MTICLLLLAVRAWAQDAPQRDEPYEFRQVVMGTEARLLLHASSPQEAQDAAQEALARLVHLEGIMSDYRPDSELSRLCQKAGQGPVPVSPDLLEVLQRSVELSRASDGAFDVTVGPLVRLWREARRSGQVPPEGAIQEALSRTGWGHLVLDPAAGTVALEKEEMQLDLGAIGKGFACDQAVAVLRRRGVDRCLVELGGDIVVGSAPPGREGWEVEIGCPEPGRPPERLTLVDCGVATSGARHQFLEADGVRYSHILDPRTGSGITDESCVCVVARDGATADGLATAVSVLGRHRGRVLAAACPGTQVYHRGPRFRSLFDGRTLEGWVTTGGRYDGHAAWSVENGCLVGRPGPAGEGGLLYTAQAYRSFVLQLETWIDYPFDSGVFLRMAPEGKGIQVTLDHRPEGEIGAIYSDGFLQHNPDGADRFRRGEWNHLEIRCAGPDLHVQVWLNGELITDYQLPAGTEGFAPTGLVGLQVHAVGPSGDAGDRCVRFRRLLLLPLEEEEKGPQPPR